MTIRDAVPTDAEAIGAFQTACWREAYRGIVPQRYLDSVTVQDRVERWRDRIGGARRVALAEDGGALVGVVSWGRRAGPPDPDLPDLELKSLYVAAAQRGTGVGSALLGRAVGKRPALLWVFENNTLARAFYTRHGFGRVSAHERDPDTGIWMVRLVRQT